MMSDFDHSEQLRATSGFPIEVGLSLSGITSADYQKAGTQPFSVLDMQRVYRPVHDRANHFAGYLRSLLDRCDSKPNPHYFMEHDNLESRHFELAQKLRHYYISKFTLIKLNGHPLTDWQQKVFEIVLHDDQRSFSEHEIDVLMYLVQEYENDLEIDRCVALWGGDSSLVAMIWEWPTNHTGRVVGGYKPIQNDGVSIFLVTEQDVLVELSLPNEVPATDYILKEIRRNQFNGISFTNTPTDVIGRFNHTSGKYWINVYPSSVNIVSGSM